MAYIVFRSDRFYVVAYDGIDPATGESDGDGIPLDTAAQMPKQSPWPSATPTRYQSLTAVTRSGALRARRA